MSIEIPNVFHAAAVLCCEQKDREHPIAAGNGLLDFDPTTTPQSPRGGFTRLEMGVYRIGLVYPVSEPAIAMVLQGASPDRLASWLACVLPDGHVLIEGDGFSDARSLQLCVYQLPEVHP